KLGDSAETLLNMLKMQDELGEKLGKLFTYAHMRNDQDTTNSFYQEWNTKAENVLTKASSLMSFIVPEILSVDEETLQSFIKENKELQGYEHVLNDIHRQRPHVLSEREENLLAEASQPMSNASSTFSMLNNADLTFPTIKN